MGLICDKQQDGPCWHALSPVQIFWGEDNIDVRTWKRIFSVMSTEADF